MLVFRERQAALHEEESEGKKAATKEIMQRSSQVPKEAEAQLHQKGSKPGWEILSQSGAKAGPRQQASLAIGDPPKPRPTILPAPSREYSPLEEGMAK